MILALVPVYLLMPFPATAQDDGGGAGLRPTSVTIGGAPLADEPYLVPQNFLVLNYALKQHTFVVSFEAPAEGLTPGYEPLPNTEWLKPYPSSSVIVAPAQGNNPSHSMFQLLLGIPREIEYMGKKWEALVIAQRLDDEFVGTGVAARVKIETQTVMITSPNGGEVWQPGSVHEITWVTTNPGPGSGTVKIEYWDGTQWVVIVASTPNDGSYTWTLPDEDFNGGIKITTTNSQGKEVTDESDGNIIIDSMKPTLTVISPNGGEDWGAGSDQNITWTANDANFSPTPITIEFYDGSAWSEVAGNETNDGSYTWAVPMKETTSAKIRITAADLAGNSVTDESNNTFTIREKLVETPVKVTSPGEGEVWEPGSTHEITWTSSNPPLGTGLVTIEYWDGTQWVTIVEEAENDGSYIWELPDTDMSDLKIRITITDPATDKTVIGLSEGTFTIGMPSAGFPMMYLGVIGGLAVITVIVGRLRWRKTHPA